MKRAWVLGLAGVALMVIAYPALAQPVISAKSGVISYIEGKVYLGAGQVEPSTTRFPEIKENQVVRTEYGRTEILLTPGMVLRLGEKSALKMITNRLIDTRVELLTGSAVVEADEIAKDNNVTLTCNQGIAAIAKAGIYRFDAEPPRVKVFAGLARVQIPGHSIEVAASKMLDLSGSRAAVEKFDKDDTDSLDNWSQRRAQLMAMANVSAAKNLRDNGGPIYGGLWGWNPYFGMYTFIPGTGRLYSPYGYYFWSPVTVWSVFYNPPVPAASWGGGYGAPSYPTMSQTSGGYSGAISAAPSASGASLGSAGSSAASAAASSSIGHGSSAGGGRGH